MSSIAVMLPMLLAAMGEAPKDITGVYAIENRPFEVDPDPADTRKRIYFELHGDLAKEMYNSLKGEVHKDVCGLSGLRLKQMKNVVCMKSPSGEHECVFVLNTESGDLESGYSC